LVEWGKRLGYKKGGRVGGKRCRSKKKERSMCYFRETSEISNIKVRQEGNKGIKIRGVKRKDCKLDAKEKKTISNPKKHVNVR